MTQNFTHAARNTPMRSINMTDAGKVDLIDNVASYPTPEGLMLTLMPAGLLPRLTAWIIDVAIRFGIMTGVSTVFSLFGMTGAGIIAIGAFLITWLYPVFFEVYKNGMTPGKKSQGIYVCQDDGTPITLQASMIRNLLRVADFLPFGFVSGALSIMFNHQSQRIGDMVAGTLVVYREQDDIKKLYESAYGMVTHAPDLNVINNAQNQSLYDPASPLFFYPLQLSEQQALVSYVERIPFLSQARQFEIASNLRPLVNANRSTPQAINEAVYYATLQRASMISGASAQGQQENKPSYQFGQSSQSGQFGQGTPL